MTRHIVSLLALFMTSCATLSSNTAYYQCETGTSEGQDLYLVIPAYSIRDAMHRIEVQLYLETHRRPVYTECHLQRQIRRW